MDAGSASSHECRARCLGGAVSHVGGRRSVRSLGRVGLRGLTCHDSGFSLDRGALDGRCCEHSPRDVRVRRRTGNAGDPARGRRAATGQRTATAGSVVADPTPRAVPSSPVQLRSPAATVPRGADTERSVAAAAAHAGDRSRLHGWMPRYRSVVSAWSARMASFGAAVRYHRPNPHHGVHVLGITWLRKRRRRVRPPATATERAQCGFREA